VQEAFIGNWTRESHLSPEVLASLHDLNRRFLDLTVAGGRLGAYWHVATPSQAQRVMAANCPYALFNLRFEDDRHWQLRLQTFHHFRVQDENIIDEETVDFVRLALFFAWHVTSSAGLAAQLLLGMSASTAAAFRLITLNDLPALVTSEAVNLTARWSECRAYWNALMGSAARSDPKALRRVQLYGLQLAAAARLPFSFGRVWGELSSRGDLPLRARPREV
jgi:hypothetical protein